jgi:mono/diheme cytochrome c family protein
MAGNRRVGLWTRTVFLASLATGLIAAQSKITDQSTGQEIFRATCTSCHGMAARGAPDATRGFEPPKTFPDFSDCSGTRREPNRDWKAVIHDGGPARGFVQIMPAFGDLLSEAQIGKLVDYLRGFCTQPAWPRGELNLPRAMVTEKAFPEDEAAVDMAVDTKSPRGFTNRYVYEQRFGARNQIDIVVPVTSAGAENGRRYSGVGDLSFGLKRVVAASVRTGTIFSIAGEVVAPTGNASRGLGKGVTVLETFGSFGQVLPGNGFLQFQAGLEFPVNTAKANRAAYWRTVLGKTYIANKGRGRLWSPMVELLADRELVSGETTNWDVLPQMQVTLSARQHVRADFGVKLPVNNRAGRSPALMFYLLWDWFDGGFRDGWK